MNLARRPGQEAAAAGVLGTFQVSSLKTWNLNEKASSQIRAEDSGSQASARGQESTPHGPSLQAQGRTLKELERFKINFEPPSGVSTGAPNSFFDCIALVVN